MAGTRFAVFLVVSAACAYSADFDIPAVPVSLNVSGQPLTITVSGNVVQDSGQAFRLRLEAELADLQSHITPLLAAEVNQSNKCGERISIETASLVPAPPEAKLTVQLHFEKWACIKALGKGSATKLVAGNGIVHMLLTPRTDESTVKLDAEIGDIEADGTLGQLLHSDLGNALRDKIRESLRKAIQRSSGLEVVVPEQARPYVTIQSVQFAERGTGILMLNLAGHVSVPLDQASAILDQFRNRQRESIGR